ncbi:MAG: enoyl-CoA hydratase/isomerase family protein [Acidobacteria bacterium]|nr:enoyl-CoA hydratase/isomerase family protein [Thermoanaerobaculia bacterium]MDI9632329.1 enoyl-CoA hydratase/isomerase family protein [Acidobacteriota bacterium]MBP7813487.1 enoyl-CoA hydratase/isomerase family protein [Thermoanaerobaculia bacterium]MBP8845560.1 enoyl-CoA hydratase/isomerase family protein [Thermoanaerobaculia bacterium]NLN10804.1 enoyl-CoA hydratase/isomerase family protein [Acidobacteriota bacterium]
MLERHEHGKLLELRLARPPVNALSPALIAALRDAIEEGALGAEALVLSGAPGIFSGGLDVPELLALARPALEEVVRDFFALLRTIAACRVPIAAAVSGHSPAGGAVLALFCDRRVMAAGEFRIGLNEVQVGIGLPSPLLAALAERVGAGRAAQLAVAGTLLPAAEALACGLVDELAPADEVVPRAVAWCRSLLALPRGPMLRTRELCRERLVAACDERAEAVRDRFVEDWFGEETQAALRALVERLQRKGREG